MKPIPYEVRSNMNGCVAYACTIEAGIIHAIKFDDSRDANKWRECMIRQGFYSVVVPDYSMYDSYFASRYVRYLKVYLKKVNMRVEYYSY